MDRCHFGEFSLCAHLVQHGSSVCCRQAEASTGLRYRCGWKTNHHNTYFSLQHFTSKSPSQQQKGNNHKFKSTQTQK